MWPGVVETSQDERFKPGDNVIVTGYDMGVGHDGGFAEARSCSRRLGCAVATRLVII
ncbi:MAG: hypothetical protein WDM70_00760 [Nitrosomonadales bacterium]